MFKKSTLKSLLFCCASFFIVHPLRAQSIQSTSVSIINNITAPSLTFKNAKSLGKTSSCGVDTLYYTFNKTTAFNAISLNASTSGNAFAQWYPAPGSVTVSGFDFYAWVSNNSNSVVALTCRMYAAGTDSMPTGLPLASVVVNIDSTFGGGVLSAFRKSAVFSSAVTTNLPYVLTLETSSAINVSVISNNWTATPPNGRSEWLSSVRIGTTYIRSYGINVGGPIFNADFIFQPYVSYPLNANFTRSTCNNGGNTVSFTNTSSSILFNPFYSVRAFQNIPQLSCMWDYGDTSGIWYAVNGSRSYAYRIPYSVKLKDTLYGWRTGCADEITQTLPAAPPTPGASNNSPLCSGATLNLRADTILGATYYWTGPNGFTSTLQNPIIINASLTLVGTYSVVAIIGQCSSAVANTSVTIISTPVATSNSPRCAGQTLNLSVTAISGAVYSWSGPNSFSSSAQSPFISSTSIADSGTYMVTVTLNGCGTLGPFMAAGTVNRVPITPVVSGNSPLCVGDNLNLTSSNYIGGSYNWSGPNGFSSTQQNPSRPSVLNSFAGTYSVIVSANNCSSLPGSTTILINNVPNSPSASSNGPLCSGQTLSLSATSIAGATYSWSGPNNFSSNSQNPIRTGLTSLDGGNYSVIATVNGCSSLAATTNVVITTLTPTPIASTNGPLCPGQNLQLSASNILNATYSWTGPNAFTSSLQNPFINGVSGTNAGIYSVTATTSGCGTSNSGNVTLVVNSLPGSPIVSNNGPVCEGQSINLTASNIVGAQYNWSGPNGYTSNVQNPVITNATNAKEGQYNVYVTVTGCGTSATSNTQVVVNNIPFSPIATSGGSVCLGDTLKLFGNSNSVGSSAIYNWTGPNSFSNSIKNPFIVNANTLNGGIYNLTVTDSGCTSPSSSVFVGIKSIPASPTAASNSPICEGETLLLNAGNIPGATYKWSGPNYISTIQNPTIKNILNDGSGTYNVIAIVNGCSSLPTNTNVVINITPTSPLVSNNGPKCVGDNITLTASNVQGATYSWSGPNNFTSSLQNPVLNNVTTNMAGDYSVIAITSSCVSIPSKTLVEVNTIPIAPTLSSYPVSGVVCSGDSLQLFASFTTGALYQWTGPAGFNSISQSPILRNVNPSMSGKYAATINKGGCSSLPTNFTVIVNESPSTSEISGLNEVKNNETTTYSVSGSAGSSYIWIAYGGGTVIAGSTTNTATVRWGAANANASIKVRETNSSNCKGQIMNLNVNVKSTIGIAEQFDAFGTVLLYPNPTNKLVNLQFDLLDNNDSEIEIIDVMGKSQMVINKFLAKKELLNIDVSNLKSGVYFVNILINENKKVMRLVIN